MGVPHVVRERAIKVRRLASEYGRVYVFQVPSYRFVTEQQLAEQAIERHPETLIGTYSGDVELSQLHEELPLFYPGFSRFSHREIKEIKVREGNGE